MIVPSKEELKERAKKEAQDVLGKTQATQQELDIAQAFWYGGYVSAVRDIATGKIR